MIWGIMLIVFGAVVWILNFTGNGWNWARDWPFLVLLFGVYEVSKYYRRKRPVSDSRLKKILSDVEKGRLKAEDALKRMEEEDE